MAKIKTFIAVAALALAVGVAPSYVSADTAKDKAAEGACTAGGGTYTSGTATTPGKCVGGNSDTDKNNINTTISAIVNTALFLVGTISVIMIIYGGIKYSTSAGDSSKITSAKNTIMYAVVGLVVSLLAFVIVNFVIANVK